MRSVVHSEIWQDALKVSLDDRRQAVHDSAFLGILVKHPDGSLSRGVLGGAKNKFANIVLDEGTNVEVCWGTAVRCFCKGIPVQLELDSRQ